MLRGETSVQPSIFVIMPFAKDYRWIYEEIICPPFVKCGFQVNRTDTEPHLELIPKRVIEKILSARLIVAVINNLSPNGINPNVMYELGICHTFKKPSMLLVEDINKIPFDLSGLLCHEYPKLNAEGYPSIRDDLVKQIETIAEQVLLNTLDFSNPVMSLVPNVFEHINPIDWIDRINFSVEEMGKGRDAIISLSKYILLIEDRVTDLSSNKDTFLGRLKGGFNFINLAMLGGILVRDLTSKLVALNESIDRATDFLVMSIPTLISMNEYNYKLYEARVKSMSCCETLKVINTIIDRASASAKLTIGMIEVHPLIRWFPKIAPMFGSSNLWILFGSVLVGGALSTSAAKKEIDGLLQKKSNISDIERKLSPLVLKIEEKLMQ